MKFIKIIALLFIVTFAVTACNTAIKKKPEIQEVSIENSQKIAFQITGMTCEIGCAKTIQSKLSKKKGITSAKVIFKDSMGLVAFNENIISKDEIRSFVKGIAGGDMYGVENLKSVTSFNENPK